MGNFRLFLENDTLMETNFIDRVLTDILERHLPREMMQMVYEIRNTHGTREYYHNLMVLQDYFADHGWDSTAFRLQRARQQEEARLGALPLNITNDVRDLARAFANGSNEDIFALADALEEAGCQQWAEEVRNNRAAPFLIHIMEGQ